MNPVPLVLRVEAKAVQDAYLRRDGVQFVSSIHDATLYSVETALVAGPALTPRLPPAFSVHQLLQPCSFTTE